MTKREREILSSIIFEIRDSDEQTDALVRLYNEVQLLRQKKSRQHFQTKRFLHSVLPEIYRTEHRPL